MSTSSQQDRQKDHELGIRFVCDAIVKDGYTIEAINTDLEQMPQVLASKDGKRTFFIVLTERMSTPSLSASLRSECIDHAARLNAICMFAPVSLWPTGDRNANGEEGFFVRYQGYRTA